MEEILVKGFANKIEIPMLEEESSILIPSGIRSAK